MWVFFGTKLSGGSRIGNAQILACHNFGSQPIRPIVHMLPLILLEAKQAYRICTHIQAEAQDLGYVYSEFSKGCNFFLCFDLKI